MKNFKKLIIWQKGIEIVKKAYDICELLPTEEKYGIKSQLSRAALSISLNVAEGSSRKSKKDYHRFLEIALGSSFEVETILVVIEEVYKVNNELLKELDNLITEEQKMLQSFMLKLNS